MTKPHEQSWKVKHTNIGPIIDDVSGRPEGEAVCMVYAPMFYAGPRLTLAQSDAIRDERAKFIEAAPDMARALLGTLCPGHRRGSDGNELHTPQCWDGIYAYLLTEGCGDDGCKATLAALRKAGVDV